MKTLKKLQSIILAAAMCFSCMAVLAATSVTSSAMARLRGLLEYNL